MENSINMEWDPRNLKPELKNLVNHILAAVATGKES